MMTLDPSASLSLFSLPVLLCLLLHVSSLLWPGKMALMAQLNSSIRNPTSFQINV